METEFTIEYLTEKELTKPKVLQRSSVVRVSLRGEMKLVDSIIALLKTQYNLE